MSNKLKLEEKINLYDYIDASKGLVLPYPFQNLTIKQIADLSNRIDVVDVNHGHSFEMVVNYEKAIDEHDSNYILLLAYISFLNLQIELYFERKKQTDALNMEYPNVYSYISSVMNNIDKLVDENIKEGKRPFPADIIESLGQEKEITYQYHSELYCIIDLLLKQKGAKISENYTKVEPTEKDKTNLSDVTNNLLKILDVPQEEIQMRRRISNQTFTMNEVNLETLLSENMKLHQL